MKIFRKATQLKSYASFILLQFIICLSFAQEYIPIDTAHWNIRAQSYVMETYKGKASIYLQGGVMSLKDRKFQNGTIEFDIFLKENQGFPGVNFRVAGANGEEWYIRPHLSGKADANQAAPRINGITPWQLCFGPRYSFAYDYKYDDWTHVKLVVKDRKAQVFLDYAAEANLSWDLFHEPVNGDIVLRGGNAVGLHIANISVDLENADIVDFEPVKRNSIPDLIQSWEISDKFEESALDNIDGLKKLIDSRKWLGSVQVEEGTAANISRLVNLRAGNSGNTVFAKYEINADQASTMLFEFGYSDRALVFLNGNPLYKGQNNWRSRDYRYLGTVGLFDAVYLNLNEGKNTLLVAVSENFGGWLVTGRVQELE